MRKTFPLTSEAREPARVVDAVKHELKKYVKRERRKPLPSDVDYLDFSCRVGQTSESAEAVHHRDLNRAIDAGVSQGWSQVYVEIQSKPGIRKPPQP